MWTTVRAVAAVIALVLCSAGPAVVGAQTDLDAFMSQVLARRDDNWKKLQQYVLDERERIEVRGPDRQPLWGEDREYTWYIREGFFVRSPLKANGVAVGEADRRKYEDEFLKREQQRERRRQERLAKDQGATQTSEQSASREQTPPVSPAQPPPANLEQAPPASLDALIRQSRQPRFISSAYFLRFKFEEGTYALVGRETLDGQSLLRIEYYPTRLYSNEQSRRQAHSHDPQDPWDAEMQRMLNKVALVTLWVEPGTHQIVKYTFDNVGFDFLPGQWLVRLQDVRASMTMSRPFPDVWLPRDIAMQAAVTLAIGTFDFRYTLDYHDYRQADVRTKVRVGGGR